MSASRHRRNGSLPRRAWLALVMAAAMASGVAAAADDVYPNRPIRMVLGFSAGGGTDVIARVLAQKMGESLGVAVVVDNKPGANGNISAEGVAKAPADGYTLLYNTSSVVLSPGLYDRLGYDLLKDLSPVGLAANLPIVLVASPAIEPKGVTDLVASMKAHPGRYSYGSAGNGNITHFSMLLFEQAAGVKGTHMPYRGEAPAITDLIGGQVQLYMGTTAGVMSTIKDKRVRALAVASAKRLPALPDVPTLGETLAKGLDLGAWSGLMAPAGTPPAVIERLSRALHEALVQPDVLAKFAAQNAEPRYAGPQQYGEFIRTELARWGRIARQSNVKLD